MPKSDWLKSCKSVKLAKTAGISATRATRRISKLTPMIAMVRIRIEITVFARIGSESGFSAMRERLPAEQRHQHHD